MAKGKKNKPGKKPERVPTEKGIAEPGELKTNEKLYFNNVNREGVYLHSFICNSCGLHFNIFSWQENRHRVENTTCPECKASGNFRHWKLVLSDNPEMQFNSGREIFNFCPAKDAQLMNDSKY